MSPIASLLKKSLNTYLVTVSFYIAPFQFSVIEILLHFFEKLGIELKEKNHGRNIFRFESTQSVVDTL